MKKIFMFAATVALLASCSNEEKTIQAPKDSSNLEVITKMSGSVTSRALVDAFKDKDELGVFMMNPGSGTDYTPTLLTYTLAGTAWQYPTDPAILPFIKLKPDKPANVFGYYPADAVVSDPTTGVPSLDVLLNATSDLTGSTETDYMYSTDKTGYAPATASTELNRAELYMHHALAKVSFVLNKDASYSKAGLVTKIELAHASKFKIGTGKLKLDITGAYTDGSTTAPSIVMQDDAKPATMNPWALAPSTTISAQSLFAPMSDTSGINVTITIDGKELTTTLPTNGVAKWEAGKNTVYTFTVKDFNLNVGAVTVVPWENAVGGSGDIVSQ